MKMERFIGNPVGMALNNGTAAVFRSFAANRLRLVDTMLTTASGADATALRKYRTRLVAKLRTMEGKRV